MTPADAFVYIILPTLAILAIIADERRRDRAAAKAQHPANWSDATEAAIVQAVGVVDDGKALVRETEAVLRVAAEGRPK
jgi:hypothetical protein